MPSDIVEYDMKNTNVLDNSQLEIKENYNVDISKAERE